SSSSAFTSTRLVLQHKLALRMNDVIMLQACATMTVSLRVSQLVELEELEELEELMLLEISSDIILVRVSELSHGS
ncbi:hypothetical protein, partial [Klebsiella pneumoniae]|uniref:hypothetical protein n=1 Tax=Klebsiella pneumoniae TaxID=573 RepID=UPI001D0F2C53